VDLGERGLGDVDRIGLAQDRNRWRALVNSVMNLRASRVVPICFWKVFAASLWAEQLAADVKASQSTAGRPARRRISPCEVDARCRLQVNAHAVNSGAILQRGALAQTWRLPELFAQVRRGCAGMQPSRRCLSASQGTDPLAEAA
jgi:hypothetical protein